MRPLHLRITNDRISSTSRTGILRAARHSSIISATASLDPCSCVPGWDVVHPQRFRLTTSLREPDSIQQDASKMDISSSAEAAGTLHEAVSNGVSSEILFLHALVQPVESDAVMLGQPTTALLDTHAHLYAAIDGARSLQSLALLVRDASQEVPPTFWSLCLLKASSLQAGMVSSTKPSQEVDDFTQLLLSFLTSSPVDVSSWTFADQALLLYAMGQVGFYDPAIIPRLVDSTEMALKVAVAGAKMTETRTETRSVYSTSNRCSMSAVDVLHACHGLSDLCHWPGAAWVAAACAASMQLLTSCPQQQDPVRQRDDNAYPDSTRSGTALGSTAQAVRHSGTAIHSTRSGTSMDSTHSSTAKNNALSRTAIDRAHSSTATNNALSSTAIDRAHSSTAVDSTHSGMATHSTHSGTPIDSSATIDGFINGPHNTSTHASTFQSHGRMAHGFSDAASKHADDDNAVPGNCMTIAELADMVHTLAQLSLSNPTRVGASVPPQWLHHVTSVLHENAAMLSPPSLAQSVWGLGVLHARMMRPSSTPATIQLPVSTVLTVTEGSMPARVISPPSYPQTNQLPASPLNTMQPGSSTSAVTMTAAQTRSKWTTTTALDDAGSYPGTPLQEAAEGLLWAAQQQLPFFSPTELSQLLWGLAKLGCRLDGGAAKDDVGGLVLEQVQYQLPVYKEEEVANSVWALAMMGARPATEWVEALLLRTSTQLPQMSISQLSQLLWGVAMFGHRPYQNWTFELSARLRIESGSMSKDELVAFSQAFSSLNIQPSTETLSHLVQRMQSHLPFMTQQDLQVLISSWTSLYRILPSRPLRKAVQDMRDRLPYVQ